MRYIRENSIQSVRAGEKPSQDIKDVAAGFQATVVRSLVGTMHKVAMELQPKTLIVAGGVACNSELRIAAKRAAGSIGVPVYFPSKHLSTDNAAMIAAAGYAHLKLGETSDLKMTADVSMRLQNFENEDASLRKSRVRYRL